MKLDTLVHAAARQGASDLHLEVGSPATIRVRGVLETFGPAMHVENCYAIARSLLDDEAWARFAERRSADLSKTIQGLRCRINVLSTTRGIGIALRLLHSLEPTLASLNLHPDLAKLVRERHGLVLVGGPTGSGKSSTLAALVAEVNRNEAWHVVTLEQPVEFVFRPRRALIRQREVGVDTPSFDQGLLDAMREDPDVLMVGEMREPETMRLTLNAAETGHLVLSTVHSSNVSEALQRVVAAFPSDVRAGVCAQLADSLLAVVCQRLSWREDLGILVPECEILRATMAVKNLVRQGHFFKLQTPMETGAKDGQFSWTRYRQWLDAREDFCVPDAPGPRAESEAETLVPARDPAPDPDAEAAVRATLGGRPKEGEGVPQGDETSLDDLDLDDDDVFVIHPPEESLAELLDELGDD